jgi:hypothetical protein
VQEYMQRSTVDYMVTHGQDGRVESVKGVPE